MSFGGLFIFWGYLSHSLAGIRPGVFPLRGCTRQPFPTAPTATNNSKNPRHNAQKQPNNSPKRSEPYKNPRQQEKPNRTQGSPATVHNATAAGRKVSPETKRPRGSCFYLFIFNKSDNTTSGKSKIQIIINNALILLKLL